MSSLFDNHQPAEPDGFFSIECLEDYGDFIMGKRYRAKAGSSSFARYVAYDENNLMQAIAEATFQRHFKRVE
jgi:hypothetical protein